MTASPSSITFASDELMSSDPLCATGAGGVAARGGAGGWLIDGSVGRFGFGTLGRCGAIERGTW
jgi:hypothetical protein